ncbi:hypothetical protein LOC67_26385 [Stieleria sp. JC731]|uniref:hypothetical protein n=1 Tax=Pirellulaceae TaxID=2691357 RepID=UPI001E459423|nr:hypothetical protein [Stieleria sp. JC731]MCC9604097.1 hypothetical protein [Stieleria sp. JC731]
MSNSDEESNPYQSALDVGDSAVTPVERSQMDFPGKMKTVGIVAAISGLLMLGVLGGASNMGESMILLLIIVWGGSCTLVSALLPGTPVRKITRAIFGFALAFPFFILYMTVCGFVTVVTAISTSAESFAFGLGCITAHIVVLLIFAVTVRGIARRLDTGKPTYAMEAYEEDAWPTLPGTPKGSSDSPNAPPKSS